MNCPKIKYGTNQKCPRGKTGLYYTQGHILQATKDNPQVENKPQVENTPKTSEGYKSCACKHF
jgi:hypothetical protein